MKILIVCPFFPPKNEIASQRPYSWAKYWTMDGHDVTVLTVEYAKESCDLTYDLNGFNIIRVKDTVPGRTCLNSVKGHTDDTVPIAKKIFATFVSAVKRPYVKFVEPTGCLIGNNFPNFLDIWAKKAIQEVCNDHWDFVISTGGPYCVHRVGLYLKSHGQADRWCVDWRDLWTRNYMAKGCFLFRGYEKKLESKMHANADFITTISDVDADILRTITETPVYTVYNGFDYDDMADILIKPRKANKRLTFLYAGTIYKGFRDPSPLLQAVSNLHKKKLITPEQIKLCFAGRNADISDIIKDFQLDNYYSFLGYLPREKILELQYDADILLFLEYGKESRALTAKIFEYLVLGKEIWAVGCTNSTVAGKLIENTNAGICFGTDVSLIENAIGTLLNQDKKERVKDFSKIDSFQRKHQARQILTILNEQN